MKHILSFLFAALCLSVIAQNKNNDIVIGHIDSVYSKILKEERKVFVYVPSAGSPYYAKVRYPVVYLFDGDAHFHSVTGMIQQLSQINGNTVLPEMIVVGITNTDRTRDLTPSHSTKGFGGDDSWLKSSGGGEEFTSFIEKELIPHIDSVYPTAPYRVLIGHSLGGLMVINTLLNHTSLFNAYISIDPSMWWDNSKFLRQAEKDLAIKKFANRALYLAMANTMKRGMDLNKLRNDTAEATEHPRAVLALADTIQKSRKNGLRSNWKFYAAEDHGAVPLLAGYDGLRFIFGFNKIMLPQTPEEAKAFNYDSAFDMHFRTVSRMMGYTVLPYEGLVNGLGYQFLQEKNFEKAFHFFDMNIKNYPGSLNAYDSMGDYYDAKGDKKKAMELFEKALSLGDFPETKAKLEKLKTGK